jgi:hypothetical protein
MQLYINKEETSMITIKQQISATATQADIEALILQQINTQLGTNAIASPVFNWDKGTVTVVGNQEDTQSTHIRTTDKAVGVKVDVPWKEEEVLKTDVTPFKPIEVQPIAEKIEAVKSSSAFVVAKPLTLDEKVAEMKASNGITTRPNFSATGNSNNFKLA